MRTLSLLLVASTICSAVTPPDQIKVPAGFKVELLREAGPDEGSWICMTQDDQGRLYISPQGTPKGASTKDQGQWGGIWRTTIVMTENPTGNIQPHVVEWKKVNVPVGDAMGMLWAFDSLYVSGMGPQGRGIYRCKSSKGDGNLDTATLFKAIPGGAGEHGAHAIVLGPDKKLYIVHGNSTGILDGLDPGSPYRHWGEDDLLPRLKDPVATFFDKIKAPYGCVYRTDADGTKWELFAGGFRNPYDIAFNADGELFTYDSDMEWDRGLPWYRPTRILHVVPGGEYGFREGSAKWPAYFPDSLPAVADIGVGCPTGMKFGTDAKGWPEKYRRALFFHDWTYGRILAVTLHEKGASYTARNDLASYTYPRDAEANGDVEVFLSGKGMPVTDLEFLRDGSMVFTVGGRGTAAALYRVSYQGGGASAASDATQIDHASELARQFRRDLEKFDGKGATPGAPDGVRWSDLKYDGHIDFAMRTALGRYPRLTLGIGLHQRMAKTARSQAETILYFGLAYARLLPVDTQEELLAELQTLPLISLPDDFKLLKLRVLELSFARQGRPSEERVKAVMEELLAHYPAPPIPANAATPARNPAAGAPVDAPAWRLNRELCALLTWLSNPELGALNADLAKADGAAKPGEPAKAPLPAPAKGKTGDFRPHDGAPDGLNGPFFSENGLFAHFFGISRPSAGTGPSSAGTGLSSAGTGLSSAGTGLSSAGTGLSSAGTGLSSAGTGLSSAGTGLSSAGTGLSSAGAGPSSAGTSPSSIGTSLSSAGTGLSSAGTGPSSAGTGPSSGDATRSSGDTTPPSKNAIPASGGIAAQDDGLLLAQAGNAARPAADTLPTEAPPVAPGSRPAALNSGLGPVPNPGADIFPDRKPAPFQMELGRQVIEKTLALMDAAPSQEEQIWYALCLRWAHGWTPEQRVRYFRWFHEKASRYTGGNSFAKFVEAIRADAASRVPEADRAALAQWLRPIASPVAAVALKPRAFVKAWTLPELEAALDKLKDRKPDLARGKDLYTQAQCAQCHLFRDGGGNVGPDLTAVAQRFGRHDILEAMTDPGKVVSEQYAMVTLTVLDGKGGTAEVSGLVKEETSATITLLTEPLAGKTSNLYKNVIVKREKATASTMPPGLLNTLTAEEVADLLALFGAK